MAVIWAELDTLTYSYSSILEQAKIAIDKANRPAKISKGENYNGLPYLVLDFPSVFDKENILSFRTMFWWGNFFSVTLHLQGIYKDTYSSIIIENLLNIDSNGLYICCNETPWHYHYDNGNYISVNNLSKEEIISLINNKPFTKLSFKLDLENYKGFKPFAIQSFEQLMLLLKANTHI